MANEYCLGNITNAPEPTVLFNGSADTTGASYTLNDDISKYKLLVVYSCVNNGTYNDSNKECYLIDVESVSYNVNDYRIYMNNLNSGTNSIYTINFCFPNNTTLKITDVYKSVSSWINPRIYKIIGIS